MRKVIICEAWIGAGESIILPTVAWHEFLCGCTPEEEHLALALLTGGLHPFGDAEAKVSAQNFRSIKTPRHLRVEAMIAGTAIVANARLATNNCADYKPFVIHGLRLA